MQGSVKQWNHIRHEVLVSAASNVIFNGILAWLLLNGGPNLGWSGENSFTVDIIATGLLLPLIVALIVIPLQRNKLKKSTLQPIDLGASSTLQALSNRFPASATKSALVFGLIGLIGIAPLTLLGFYVIGIEEVGPLAYAIFKGIWTGLMAGILVIPMVLIALRNPHASNLSSCKD